jgi:hypothetical protein
MPEGYLHLTYEQRCQIYALVQSAHSQADIARQQAGARHGLAATPPGLNLIYPGTHRSAIFEPVTKNHNSVAHAVMMFQDIALLGSEAPTRVVVVPTKKEMGTFLGVLSQSAKVIDESASDEAILSLVKAA